MRLILLLIVMVGVFSTAPVSTWPKLIVLVVLGLTAAWVVRRFDVFGKGR